MLVWSERSIGPGISHMFATSDLVALYGTLELSATLDPVGEQLDANPRGPMRLNDVWQFIRWIGGRSCSNRPS